jgi:hypothetical protein
MKRGEEAPSAMAVYLLLLGRREGEKTEKK